MLSLASVGGLRASRAEGAWRVQARKYTNNFPNGQFRALFFRPFVGHSGKRSMSAPRSVANMFPYRFPAPVVPGSVAARPAVPSGPASSFPFRSPPSRSFLPQVVSSPVVSHRSVRTPVFGRFLSGPRPGPSRDNSQSAQALRQTVLWRFAGSGPSASQAVVATAGGLFSSAPHRALPGLGTSAGFKTSYLGLFRHLGRAGNP